MMERAFFAGDETKCTMLLLSTGRNFSNAQSIRATLSDAKECRIVQTNYCNPLKLSRLPTSI